MNLSSVAFLSDVPPVVLLYGTGRAAQSFHWVSRQSAGTRILGVLDRQAGRWKDFDVVAPPTAAERFGVETPVVIASMYSDQIAPVLVGVGFTHLIDPMPLLRKWWYEREVRRSHAGWYRPELEGMICSLR